MDVRQYLIDIEPLDWAKLIPLWSWLIPKGVVVQPWIMNCFGDLFWIDGEEQVRLLNITDGTCEVLASNEDEFLTLIDEEDRAAEWLMIPLVDRFRPLSRRLKVGESYGYKVLPVLGGGYQCENFYVTDIMEYWGYCGTLHRQLSALPDGATIQLDLLPKRGTVDPH